MDNLFLFIKNFFVSFVDKIDEQFLYGNIKFYLDNINKFNTSDILFQVLKNMFKANQNLSTILFETVELKIEQKKKILIQDFNDLKYNDRTDSIEYEASGRRMVDCYPFTKEDFNFNIIYNSVRPEQ